MAKGDKPAAGDVLIARQTGFVSIDGVPHPVRKGVTRVRVGHPVQKTAPDFFEAIDDHIHYDLPEAGTTKVVTEPIVEAATAAPGEKRGAPDSTEVTGEVEKVTVEEPKVEKATKAPGEKKGLSTKSLKGGKK